ncbi:MAG: hypothetical protein IJD49_04150 [Clostridia bacterium]|nr:hypothetical protein [Clostridia bacterium]
MKKTMKSNEINGGIYAQLKGANSISFCAELPEGAEVKHIRLVGKVTVNGTKYTNPYLENLDGVVVGCHYNSEDASIATAYFVDGLPEEILLDVLDYKLSEFEVTYSAPCPCCGG